MTMEDLVENTDAKEFIAKCIAHELYKEGILRRAITFYAAGNERLADAEQVMSATDMVRRRNSWALAAMDEEHQGRAWIYFACAHGIIGRGCLGVWMTASDRDGVYELAQLGRWLAAHADLSVDMASVMLKRCNNTISPDWVLRTVADAVMLEKRCIEGAFFPEPP